ncbi:MAG: prolyl oligopeptidase family serine peptidase [Planctomycetota bacterium]
MARLFTAGLAIVAIPFAALAQTTHLDSAETTTAETAALTAAAGTTSTASAKKPLDHDVYDIWNRLAGTSISPNGQWAAYTIAPGDGDNTVVVRQTKGREEYRFERGRNVRFSDDSSHALVLVQPDDEVVKQQRKDKVPVGERDKQALHVLDLATGDITVIERVKSYAIPNEEEGVVAILLEEEPEKKDKKDKPAAAAASSAGSNGSAGFSWNDQSGWSWNQPDQPARRNAEENEDEADDGDKKRKKRGLGTTLILHRLETGGQVRFDYVTDYEFDENGRKLAFIARTPDDENDGVYIVDTTLGFEVQIASGAGRYKSLAFSEEGDRLLFLTDRDLDQELDNDERGYSLYAWTAGDRGAASIAAEGDRGIPVGWWVADNPSPRFSESGERVIFGTQPRPEIEPEEDKDAEDDDEPKVKLDIWHWQDARLQPQQLLQASRERDRSYTAVVLLEERNAIVQLANEDMPSVIIGSDGDADYAVANTDVPYAIEDSWATPGYVDSYVIDVRTGYASKVLERHLGFGMRLSPNSEYLVWDSGEKEELYCVSVQGAINGKDPTILNEDIPYPVFNELHDTPSVPRPYGTAGWTDDDESILIYDRYDIWEIDPDGRGRSVNITEEFGRENEIRLRYASLDRDQDTIDPSEDMLLSAFGEKTKQSGYFTDSLTADILPSEIIMIDERLSGVEKAEDTDDLIVTRQTFENSPNLYHTTTAMDRFRQLSDINPQQDEYLWGTAELHEWISADGEELQGILYKPENFDPDKKYPMMVYFYERLSDRLHGYEAPAPARASINTSFYVSRGYVVFKPDIPYREGFPGRSAESAILPGVTSVIELGFVDPDRIGIQGHSWGGYQSLHLVTVTDMFAAAESGAPVSNMTSAYGGIRWASGLVRQFQYERTQSRIGATLWEKPSHYIENSPLFRADEIDTPLLILHNDEDGAVPWYQGIEIFNAMRRLGKPAWMFNYNGEAHGLRQRHNQKDWSVRMQQFFDHYLMDAPAPVWLVEGVPATEKGENMGLELVDDK